MDRTLLLGCLVVSGSLGCSEPVPPAAQGATYVAFSTAGNCAIGAPHNGRIGYVTTLEVRDFAVDTVAGAQVFCRVQGNGTGFKAEGSMTTSDATHLDFNISNISAENTPANPATGSLSYRHVETVNQYTTPPAEPCEFWISPGDAGQGIKEGELWVEFRCPVVQNASIDSTCGIAQSSTLAMKDCEI